MAGSIEKVEKISSWRDDPAGKYPIPQYIPPQKYETEKGEDNMYPFNNLGFNLTDVEERNDDILSNLTLFAPFSHEDDVIPSSVNLERPITPINDEIKCPPTQCQKLTKLVRRRLIPQPDVPYLGEEEQKQLEAIILGEVNGIWPDFKTQVEDPFLTMEENKELQRRITVHIITVCEQLFTHYLQKAEILNKRGVFSGPANMSRLKAQLALDTNKFLNILTIRRYIVGDLKRERSGELTDSDDENYVPIIGKQTSRQYPLLSYQGLIEASRPKTKAKRRIFNTPHQHLSEMERGMPDLDTSKLLPLLNDLPSEVHEASKMPVRSRKKPQPPKEVQRKTSEDLSKEKVLLKKSDSVPKLYHGETLFEELGIPSERTGSALSMGDVEEGAPPGEEILQKQQQEAEEDKSSKPEPGSWEYRQEDLRRLVGRLEDDGKGADTEEDLPPLLQAVTCSDHQQLRKQEIEKRLEYLDKMEEERREKESINIREPTHPQPATVSTMMSNKTFVRTSDIRVSERVCMSSIPLKQHQAVYNDLIDEIDPSVVKKLDSNLFLGDEITEVYKEIMKTVPTDHLDLENDPAIEKAANSLNLSAALASSTLSNKRNDRIINDNLRRDIDPPWGTLDVNDWAKTPHNPPKDIKGRAIVNPQIPKGQGLDMKDFYGEGYQPPSTEQPQEKMPEVMARSYASWLTWWKNTINSDDYMKYLSTQETDFMGVVFHFYNSDDEDDDDVVTARTKAAKHLVKEQRKEKVKKLNEMKKQKTEFSDGFWNANSVLMGGLGGAPSLGVEEVEENVALTEPQTMVTRHTPTQLIMKKSQKSSLSDAASTKQTREETLSRNSQTKSGAGTKHSTQKEKEKENDLSIQERLEQVWTELRFPDNQKLDMAIKYSSDQYHPRLEDALEIWEEVSKMIEQREKIVAKLEIFERMASDPNRFFEKGQRGSSVARLEEARMRSLYYKKIEVIEEDLSPILEMLNRDYQDIVTYQGRPYMDKMRFDRTEMLFWLQEERKQQALEYETRVRHLTPLPHNLVKLGAVA